MRMRFNRYLILAIRFAAGMDCFSFNDLGGRCYLILNDIVCRSRAGVPDWFHREQEYILGIFAVIIRRYNGFDRFIFSDWYHFILPGGRVQIYLIFPVTMQTSTTAA